MSAMLDLFPFIKLGVALNIPTGAGNSIVAAPGANNRILVMSYHCTAAASFTLQWKSAATAITGIVPYLINAVVTREGSILGPVLVCNPNEALILDVVVAAVNILGVLTYAIVPA